MIAILKYILLKNFKLIALHQTNIKRHLKPPASIALKPDHERTQVVVQAQQYKALLQVPFQQRLFHRAIEEADQVQPGMPTSAYAQ